MPLNSKIRFVFGIGLNMFLVSNLKAQSYLGMEVGMTRNSISMASADKEHFNIQSQNGLSFGMFFSKHISATIDLLVEPTFIQKNYKKNSTINNDINEHFTNNYISLPINLSANITKKKRISTFIGMGGYFGYWLTASEQSYLPDLFGTIVDSKNGYSTHLVYIGSKHHFDSTTDNRYDFGANIFVSEMFDIKGNKVGLKLSFLRSFSSMAKNLWGNNESMTNQSFNFSIVYALPFHRI